MIAPRRLADGLQEAVEYAALPPPPAGLLIWGLRGLLLGALLIMAVALLRAWRPRPASAALQPDPQELRDWAEALGGQAQASDAERIHLWLSRWQPERVPAALREPLEELRYGGPARDAAPLRQAALEWAAQLEAQA